MSPNLRLATADDRVVVVEPVRQYHDYDRVPFDENATASALEPLLQQGDAGRIWLIELNGGTIGYVALCFGYSIEFGGRDAFVDEMFVVSGHRGKGVGRAVLEDIQTRATDLDIRALHLEVGRSNERARSLYRSLGFSSRERFHLISLVL